ncbi:MAG: hypothetical protein Q8O86_07955 [Dehalococcoidia bacterium]|nr:hypothetical protein [Dehalococcoidia bacterium]
MDIGKASKIEQGSPADLWREVARGRLYFELGGLAFAVQKGFTPTEFGRHVWGHGAVQRTGKADPTALEYMGGEAKEHLHFIPDIQVHFDVMEDDLAQMTLSNGCWGGYGKKRWGTASYWGLSQDQVCEYCHECYRAWGEQIGLSITTNPQADGTCFIRATRP